MAARRMTLEQAAKMLLAELEPSDCWGANEPALMCARAVLEAAKRAKRYRRDYGPEYLREIVMMGELWAAMKRAARGKR